MDILLVVLRMIKKSSWLTEYFLNRILLIGRSGPSTHMLALFIFFSSCIYFQPNLEVCLTDPMIQPDRQFQNGNRCGESFRFVSLFSFSMWPSRKEVALEE